jgi:trehalose-phosphatase
MIKQAGTLLAFDFDGTLAPICDDPADVRIHRAAAALVRETAQTQGLVVALASGRDVDDLAARTDVPCAYLIGSHGLEIRAPGGLLIRDAPPLEAQPGEELRREIASFGMRLETKKHAVALHWRGVDIAGAEAAIERFREWARGADLEVIEGRCVVEARVRGGGKEEALRWLATAAGTSRVIYAGDDITDFGALRFAAERGRGVFIASSERTAPPGVTVVGSFRELFRIVRKEVMV